MGRIMTHIMNKLRDSDAGSLEVGIKMFGTARLVVHNFRLKASVLICLGANAVVREFGCAVH